MTTQELARNDSAQPAEYLTPAVEIVEDDQAVWVEADLPGVSVDTVEVAVDDGYLTVAGRVTNGANGTDSARTYRRRFALSDPSHFDTEHISAVLRHGVLALRLPKVAPAQPRKIPITVN
jgi:HSP20 family protein